MLPRPCRALGRGSIVRCIGLQYKNTVTSSDDIARAMNAIRSIVRALRLNTRSIEGKLGISLAQLFVLQQLLDKPAESLNELAERTATHQSSVSVVVRRLVDAGLVTRTSAPHDRRRVHIALTELGRQRLDDAPPTVQFQLTEALQSMSTEQRHTLADLLEQWAISAGLDVSPMPMLFEEDGDED